MYLASWRGWGKRAYGLIYIILCFQQVLSILSNKVVDAEEEETSRTTETTSVPAENPISATLLSSPT